jgi:hypothetical protein
MLRMISGVACGAAVLLVSNAFAQATFTYRTQQPSDFGAEPVIRVNVTFRAAVAVSEGQSAPDGKAQEAARRELYASAGRECTILGEAFQAECRLSNISVFVNVNPPNGPASNVMSATAGYELRPKPASSR